MVLATRFLENTFFKDVLNEIFRTIICKKLLRLRKDIHRVTLVYLSFLCVNFYISIFPLTDRQAPRECGQHAGVGQSELCQSRPGIVTGYPNGRIRPS